MPARSIRHAFEAKAILPTTSHAGAADLTTAWIDTRGFDACLVLLDIGNFSVSTDFYTLRFEHTDDPTFADTSIALLNPWAAPDTGEIFLGAIAVSPADTGKTIKMDYLLGKRFARLVINPDAGNSGSADFTATAVLGLPNITPA